MSLLELLKYSESHGGLLAPAFLWYASAVLIAGTFSCLMWLCWLVLRERRLHRKIRTRLESVTRQFSRKAGDGLSAPAYDAVVRLFEQTPPLSHAWQNYNSMILRRRDSSGEEQYWSTEIPDQAFSESAVIDTRLNRAFFQSIPGIVTGAGLLCTFVAILVALLDLKFENNLVIGVEHLISGLSGGRGTDRLITSSP
jgi:hypothetical protein